VLFCAGRICYREKSRDREKMASGTLWRSLERRIANALNLAPRPVAVAFLDAAPSGLEQFQGTEPSGGHLALDAKSPRTRFVITLPKSVAAQREVALAGR
jgi:hypothetical protein